MEHKQNETFQYSYSARQQEEIQAIRRKYQANTESPEDKMEQLRRLDAGVTRKGTVISLLAGILGCLILGTGMSCIMVFGGIWFAPGVVIGAAGIACVAAAYPLYQRITRKERERLAPEILRLTDELLQE